MRLKLYQNPRNLIFFALLTCLSCYTVVAGTTVAASGSKGKTQNQQLTAKADNEVRPIEFGNLIEREIQTAQTHIYQTKGRADGVLRVRLEADARDAAFDMFIVDA